MSIGLLQSKIKIIMAFTELWIISVEMNPCDSIVGSDSCSPTQPCFSYCDNTGKETVFFIFIPFQMLLWCRHSVKLLFLSQAVGNRMCTEFPVLQMLFKISWVVPRLMPNMSECLPPSTVCHVWCQHPPRQYRSRNDTMNLSRPTAGFQWHSTF